MVYFIKAVDTFGQIFFVRHYDDITTLWTTENTDRAQPFDDYDQAMDVLNKIKKQYPSQSGVVLSLYMGYEKDSHDDYDRAMRIIQ